MVVGLMRLVYTAFVLLVMLPLFQETDSLSLHGVQRWYVELRGVVRLVYTAFVLLVMLPLFRRSVAPAKLTSALWWIRVSGAEHLAIMPLTFLVGIVQACVLLLHGLQLLNMMMYASDFPGGSSAIIGLPVELSALSAS